jgi:hypothetical protein
LLSQRASAYGALGSRSIQMSSSVVSATAVSYNVSFYTSVSTTVKSIVVDFCDDSPLIGTTCTRTNEGGVTASPGVSGATGGLATGTWTASTLNSNKTFTYTNTTGAAMNTSVTLNSITITTAVNPSTTGTFYARILTFPNSSGADSAATYTDTAPGNAIDAGGLALSTAAQITITSKVQERLIFCVYTTGAGNNCTSKSGTTVTLGDTNGVLDPTGPYVDKTAKYSISTNASGNAAVRLKGDTLTTGSFTINAIGATATASSAGTEQFGFCNVSTAGTGLTASAPYNAATCDSATSQTAGTGSTGGAGAVLFAYDTANTNTTYGQTISSKAPGDYSTGEMVFLGNIANTTEAGIYTTTLTFIATGTY